MIDELNKLNYNKSMKAITLHQAAGLGGDYSVDRRTSTGGD
jgi:hypothetical protein